MSNGPWRFFHARMSHKWYTNVPEMSPSGDGETLEWKQKGAIPLFQPLPGGPKLLMLADEGAQEIFSTYLS